MHFDRRTKRPSCQPLRQLTRPRRPRGCDDRTRLLDLAVAEKHLDAVELDLVLANLQLEPHELAVVTADVICVVVANEADMAVREDLPQSPA